MAKGNNPNCYISDEVPTRSGAPAGNSYNNFFGRKMAELDRTATQLAPAAHMHPEDVSDILKKGGLGLIAGTLFLGPIGFAGAMAYIGFKATRAWQRAKAPMLDEHGQPLLDARGRQINSLGRPINPDGKGIVKNLRQAGLGGLVIGGGLALATGGALLPMAAAGALGATGYQAVKGWEKLRREEQSELSPQQDEDHEAEDIGMQAFVALTRSKEGAEMLDQTALSIINAGGDSAGPEKCIEAISQDLGCDPKAAEVLYEGVRAACQAGHYPQEVVFAGGCSSSPSGPSSQQSDSQQRSSQQETTGQENSYSSQEGSKQKESTAPKADAVYICGHPRRDGSPCRMTAGWATATPGQGPCIHHGGQRRGQSTAQKNVVQPQSSKKESAQPRSGKEVPVTPIAFGEMKSTADLRRKGQEVMQAAILEGRDFSPEFIAEKLSLSEQGAELL